MEKKKFLNLAMILFIFSAICADADINAPVEIRIRYINQPELGKPIKIVISSKPLIDGESLEVKLVIPNSKIKPITGIYKKINAPLKDKVYTLPVELNIPDGKAYQIIAFAYLTSNDQKYSNSRVMNIDLGEPEKPRYSIINRYAPDGTPIIGVAGVHIQSQKGIKW